MNTINDRVLELLVENNFSRPIYESVVEDTEDIFYNRIPYENGDINLLFIIGYSGGGKSTMSRSEDKFGREVVDMDKMVFGTAKSDEYFKKMGKFAYSFMTGPGAKYRLKEDEDMKANLRNATEGFRKDISLEIIDYAKKYANQHKSTRLVMEGVWIYRYVMPSDLDSYAVYIKGTSLKTSTERAVKRDNANFDKEDSSKLVKVGKKAGNTIGKLFHSAKDIISGSLEKYQKYYKEKYKKQLGDKINYGKKIVNATARKIEDTAGAIGSTPDVIKKSLTKESTYVDTKINIYEAYEMGLITESEKIDLINMLED